MIGLLVVLTFFFTFIVQLTHVHHSMDIKCPETADCMFPPQDESGVRSDWLWLKDEAHRLAPAHC